MSDYWERMETQPSIKDWLEMWHGCVACACDHGCNQWLAKNGAKSSLIMEALKKKKSKEELNKLAQMPIEESYATWRKWSYARSRRFNKKLKLTQTESTKPE